MGLVPGWNSISSATWWSNFYFWFGIVCLFLLGISEVVSHIYTLRKDVLVEAADRAATRQRGQEQQQENERRNAETTALQRQAIEAEQALTKLRNQQIPRSLSPQQQTEITAALLPFHGQKFSITWVATDDEGKHLFDQLVSAITAARWEIVEEGQTFFSDSPIGILIKINQSDAENRQIPIGTSALVHILLHIGLVNEKKVISDPGVRQGQIEIVVGRKPTTP